MICLLSSWSIVGFVPKFLVPLLFLVYLNSCIRFKYRFWLDILLIYVVLFVFLCNFYWFFILYLFRNICIICNLLLRNLCIFYVCVSLLLIWGARGTSFLLVLCWHWVYGPSILCRSTVCVLFSLSFVNTFELLVVFPFEIWSLRLFRFLLYWCILWISWIFHVFSFIYCCNCLD